MKKTLLTMLLALAAIIPSQAKILKYGIEGGLNLNKFTTNSTFSSDNRAGWFIGPKVQATIPLAGLMVDGALQYSQMYMDVSDATTGKKEKGLPHVILPINIKYAIGLGSYVSLYLSTGPQWNWYLGDKSVAWDGNTTIFERSTFAWNVGIGAHLLKHLQVGATYNIGFGKPFAEVDAASLISADTWRNNNLQVRVAYMF